jgi:hypothetical protein
LKTNYRMELTYELIEPLIVEQQFRENKVECSFSIPGSSKVVRSYAGVRALTNTMGRSHRRIKNSANYYARKQATNVIRRLLGGGIISRTLVGMANEEIHMAQKVRPIYTPSQKQAAIVEAFRRVQREFTLNPVTGKWSQTELVSDFSKQLLDYPIQENYDKGILARMLMEMARVDGNVSEEEEEILDLFVNKHEINRDVYLQDSLNYAELEGCSKKAKGSLFMLAATMVLSDKVIDQEEKGLLAHYANGLSIDKNQANRYILLAKKFIVENALPYLGGRAALHEFANQIKLPTIEADRLMVEYNKRNS